MGRMGVENTRVLCTTAALEDKGTGEDRERGRANKLGNANKVLRAPQLNSELPTTSAQAAACGAAEDDPLKGNGDHFLHVLKGEQTRLLLLAADAENCIVALSNDDAVSEDILGLLRAAAGKARLLVSQKMRQFEELCHRNLLHSPGDKLPITGDDLAGFWDMVNLQIEEVNEVFANVKRLQGNGWKHTEPPAAITSVSKKPKRYLKALDSKPICATIATSARSEAAALKREAQRQLLLEFKRKSRKALAAEYATDGE